MSALSRIFAIAHNTFREAIRNKVLSVLVLFVLALMGFSMVLGALSLHETERVMKDLGLAGMSACGVLIACFLAVNLLAKELERKTVYAIIPKPIHRWEFLIGKYLGVTGTMLLLIASMSVALAAFIAMEGARHGIALVRAEVLVALELSLLIAVTTLFTSFSSPYLSAMFSSALWVIGRNTGELEAFAAGKLKDSAGGALLEWIVRIIPDYRLFYISGANFDDAVVSIHGSFISWAYVGNAALYALAYSSACLLASIALFSRRDLV